MIKAPILLSFTLGGPGQSLGLGVHVSVPVQSPEGPYTLPSMELGPQNHNGDGLLGANSTIVVYMDPLGSCFKNSSVVARMRS